MTCLKLTVSKLLCLCTLQPKVQQQQHASSKAHTATRLAVAPRPCSSTSTQVPKRTQAPLPTLEVRTPTGNNILEKLVHMLAQASPEGRDLWQ